MRTASGPEQQRHLSGYLLHLGKARAVYSKESLRYMVLTANLCAEEPSAILNNLNFITDMANSIIAMNDVIHSRTIKRGGTLRRMTLMWTPYRRDSESFGDWSEDEDSSYMAGKRMSILILLAIFEATDRTIANRFSAACLFIILALELRNSIRVDGQLSRSLIILTLELRNGIRVVT